MQVKIQKAQKRGKIDFNWAKGHHYFSFGSYYNPLQLNYGALNVFSHYNLEKLIQFEKATLKYTDVVTILLKGNLRQNSTVEDRVDLKEGQILHLSCGGGGEGCFYQLQNPSENEKAEFIQIYLYKNEILSQEQEEQKSSVNVIAFDNKQEHKNTEVIVCDNLQNGYITQLFIESEKEIELRELKNENYGYYIVVLEGNVEIQDKKIEKGDVFMSKIGEKQLKIKGGVSSNSENKKEIVSRVFIIQSDLSKHNDFQMI